MGRLQALLLVVFGCFVAACAAPPQIQQLPAYGIALGLVDADAPRPPKLFVKGVTPEAVFDDLVPYAQVEGMRNMANTWQSAATALAERLIRVMPDAFCYVEGKPEVAGVVTTHVGFGVSTGSTVQFAPVTMQALRAAPSRMPFELHPETDVVVVVRDKAAVGAMTEGDTLTSVGGWSVLGPEPYAQSVLARRRLELQPGDKLEIEWVRSGVGKMSGSVQMLPLVREGRAVPEAAALLPDHVVRTYRDDAGAPFWGYHNPHNPYGN